MIMVNMPKQSNGDKIIPIKYINNKIIVQKQSADNKIDGFQEWLDQLLLRPRRKDGVVL